MIKPAIVAACIPILAHAIPADANSCECSQVIGSCDASVQIKPTGGKKHQYGADLSFTANAAQCAKVEYYIGSTPYQTLLPDGRHATDRILGIGPRPVAREDISDLVCKVCKTEEQIRHEQAEADAKAEAERQQEEARLAEEARKRLEQEEVERLVASRVNSGTLSSDAFYTPRDQTEVMNEMLSAQMQMQAQMAQQRAQREREKARHEAELEARRQEAQARQARAQAAAEAAKARQAPAPVTHSSPNCVSRPQEGYWCGIN